MDDEKDTLGRPEFDTTVAPPKKKKAKRLAKKRPAKKKAKVVKRTKREKKMTATKHERSAKKPSHGRKSTSEDIRLDFRVPKGLKQKLNAKAKATRRTITSIIQELIEKMPAGTRM